MIINKQHQQAANKVGAKGARALGEALKTNTALQSLHLGSEQEKSVKYGWISDIANNKRSQPANKIGADGAGALSEALKTNTALQTLHLWGKEEREEDGWIIDIAKNTNTNKQTTTLEQKEQKH